MTDRRHRNHASERGPRVNQAIRAPRVLLIGPDGVSQGEVSLEQAMQAARDAGLDLVEVAPGPPPVCKVIDYGKWRYEQSRRRKPPASPQVKEVKVRLGIAEHDLAVKLRKLCEFADDGHRVRFVVMLRGREIGRPEAGIELANTVIERVAEHAVAVSEPQVAGRDVVVMFNPRQPSRQRRAS